jgi:hypothetical protein
MTEALLIRDLFGLAWVLSSETGEAGRLGEFESTFMGSSLVAVLVKATRLLLITFQSVPALLAPSLTIAFFLAPWPAGVFKALFVVPPLLCLALMPWPAEVSVTPFAAPLLLLVLAVTLWLPVVSVTLFMAASSSVVLFTMHSSTKDSTTQ